jgi:hypothetical protein
MDEAPGSERGSLWEGSRTMTELAPRGENQVAHEMICVCCNCKRVRIAPGEWREHTPHPGEQLTHGICPTCLFELYPEIAPLVRSRVRE